MRPKSQCGMLLSLIAMTTAVLACGQGHSLPPENARVQKPLIDACGSANTIFAFNSSATTDPDELLDLRLQVDYLGFQVVGPNRQIVAYGLEIENRGTEVYAVVPALQVFVSSVAGQSGVWGATEAALIEGGLTVSPLITQGAQIAPGETLRLTLAAYTPGGMVQAITYLLDPLADDPKSANRADWLLTGAC